MVKLYRKYIWIIIITLVAQTWLEAGSRALLAWPAGTDIVVINYFYVYLHAAGWFLFISAGRSWCSGASKHPASQPRPSQVNTFLQTADRQEGKEEKLTRYPLFIFSLPSTL